MEEYIKSIVEVNSDLFGKINKIEKINIGFTNTIYNVNDKYVVKICNDINNEDFFKKEIDFYLLNKDNDFILKYCYSDIRKKCIPFYYEILEKINGVSLYNVWHTYSEYERENIIKQLCVIMKRFHSIKGDRYNWSEYIKNRFIVAYDKVKKLNIFNDEENDLLKKAYSCFDKYLDSDEFVLIHNDLHFDNIFVDKDKVIVIDFERSMYAPRDYELDIIYRMIRKPWKFASEESEKYTNKEQYSNIMKYIKKYYSELFDIDNLYIRLGIYDIVYYLEQLIEYPHLGELKNDVLDAVKLVI